MASYIGIGADDPNHPLEVEGQVFISNVEQGSATNLVPFEVYSDYSGITGDILEGARQLRLRVTPSDFTSSNVNMDMGIEPTGGDYFYISNPVENATLGSNAAFRIVQAGHVEIGSNLSVSGNVVASNIIGGSPLTLSSDTLVTVDGSGGLSVTGPVNVDGTVSGTSAIYSGQVQAAALSVSGSLAGSSLSVSGDVQGTSASLGAIDGSSLSVSGDVTCATGTIADYIVHADDTNTYFGFINPDDIVFNTSGFERMRIENTGDIGIGTTNPRAKLEVVGKVIIHDGSATAPGNGTTGSAGTRLVLWPGETNSTPFALGIQSSALWYGTPASAVHIWYVGTSEKMRIATSGNVGINTASPAEKLDVFGNIKASSGLFIHSTGATNNSGLLGESPGLTTDHYVYTRAIVNENQVGNNPSAIVFGNGGTYGDDQISLITNGNTRMYFKSGGNIGIGTTNPASLLHLYGGSATLNIESTSGYGIIEMVGSSGSYIDLSKSTASDFNLRIITYGTGATFNNKGGPIRFDNTADNTQYGVGPIMFGARYGWNNQNKNSIGYFKQSILCGFVSQSTTTTTYFNLVCSGIPQVSGLFLFYGFGFGDRSNARQIVYSLVTSGNTASLVQINDNNAAGSGFAPVWTISTSGNNIRIGLRSSTTLYGNHFGSFTYDFYSTSGDTVTQITVG